ncbi:protein ERGIC-53-like [Bombina bombina]|uniref:protein ERGIC-53-like n=1 Tax=Bombina bombina TaxID=8345 RepID=UPI00235B0B84|nr:protein ERGIC-53-like [Bombina bombina]
MTYSLSETWEESPAMQVPNDEKKKFDKDFDKFQKELEKQIKDFQKTHPKPNEDVFESENQRELEMVLGGQARVLEDLSVLKERLEMALEEQKRYRGFLINSKTNETTTVKEEHVHDALETVMNGMPDLLSMLKELKGDISKMTAKAKELYPSADKESSTSNSKNIALDVNEDFNKIKKSLQGLVKNTASGHQSPCPLNPSVTSCVSGGMFVTFLLFQTLCTVIYMLYSSRKNSGSKKFY